MRVGIALGSNVGDRATHLQNAVRALRALGEPPFLVSRAYETEPVDCPPGSESFLNAAVEIGWSAGLRNLLVLLQDLEIRAGRDRIRVHNGPRPLDLDILYADDQEVNDVDFQVPHPRIFDRAFVLVPLGDIVPDRCLPRRAESIAEAIGRLDCADFCKIKHSEIVVDK